MRLCPLTDPSASGEATQLSETCLSKYQLQLSNGTGSYLYPMVSITYT